ncbi:MAG: biopolymer transporter ExbD, partial [bacterium TMED198]
MKLTKRTQNKSEISTASLPDIIFMLLIFFMVTTVLREFEGLDVNMPRAKMIEKLESKRHTAYIWATKDGVI